MDYRLVASELLRAIRGTRSQEAFARRLGCRSNAIYTWESGRNFPTAARALRAAKRANIDVSASLRRFYRTPPAWLATSDPTQPETVARFLNDLRGTTPIVDLARASGYNRFSVSRWLKGQSQPRLPDFLYLIEATSLRVIDFIACFVDPELLPHVARAYRDLEAVRLAAYQLPWSHAFLRALELESYRALPKHRPGWLAAQMGIDRVDEERSFELLSKSGQIVIDDSGHYVPTRITTVDTRRDPDAARSLRLFFSRIGYERLVEDSQGTRTAAAYNLFGISEADLSRIRELQRAYFRQMRAIIAESKPVEKIVLANMQLIELTR
jgi:transcriptional regulator with XRE-family HTH domain